MTVYHKHHVIPRHAGGTDDPDNLVRLTVEDHADAHRILFEQYGRWQGEIAWKALSGLIPRADVIREVNRLKSLGRKHSTATKAKMSAGRIGKLHTEATKAKCRSSKLGVVFTQQHLERLSKSHMGNAMSPETRRKISEAKIGRTPSENARRNMSIAATGRRLSEDTKRKISEARRSV